jgi:hypothetical protein
MDARKGRYFRNYSQVIALVRDTQEVVKEIVDESETFAHSLDVRPHRCLQ